MGTASAYRVREANEAIALAHKPVVEAVQQVDGFVREHRYEPGFSVAFDPAWNTALPPPVGRGVPLMTILFRGYEDNFHPRYVLRYEADGLQWEGPMSTEPARHEPVFPRVVRAGDPYNVIQYGNWYWGVPCKEVFCLARAESGEGQYIRASTLAELDRVLDTQPTGKAEGMM